MEQESQSTDSLYDFLYIDKERASSLLTQLYTPGVVKSIKRTASDSDKEITNGGFDVKLAKAGISIEEAITHTQEKLFDASWALPINLLDKLSEDGFIHKGIDGARLGNNVIITGDIRFFDISFIKKSIPFMGKVMLSQMPISKGAKKVKFEDIPIAENLTLGLMEGLFDVIPDSLQVDFMDDYGNNIWMTISRDNFTINPDDMMLKYGGEIPGEWHVLGLVDALPDTEQTSQATFPIHPIKDGMKDMLSGIKEMAGRPDESYGMTPLIIFRKIS